MFCFYKMKGSGFCVCGCFGVFFESNCLFKYSFILFSGDNFYFE